MLEGDGFHVFLDAAGDLALVAPGVDSLEVGDDGVELRAHGCEACGCF